MAQEVWRKSIGHIVPLDGNGLLTALSPDGSIYITGLVIVDNNAGTLLAKYSSDGEEIWSQLLETTISPRDIISDSKGDILICGDKKLDSAPHIFKYSDTGTTATMVWEKQVTYLSIEVMNINVLALDIGSDESIYITGYIEIDNNTSALFLRKYSENTDEIWTQTIEVSTSDEIDLRSTDLAIAPDGSIYITGRTSVDLDGQTNQGLNDAFVIKYIDNGNTATKEWTRLLGTVENDESYAIAVSSDGSIYITGLTNGNLDEQANNGSTDLFLTKYRDDGTRVWTKLIGTSEFDASILIAAASDGSIYITGFTSGNLDGQTNTTQGLDTFVSKYTSDGTKVWTRLLGIIESGSYGSDLVISSDGSIYISGLCFNETEEGFLIKYTESDINPSSGEDATSSEADATTSSSETSFIPVREVSVVSENTFGTRLSKKLDLHNYHNLRATNKKGKYNKFTARLSSNELVLSSKKGQNEFFFQKRKR